MKTAIYVPKTFVKLTLAKDVWKVTLKLIFETDKYQIWWKGLTYLFVISNTRLILEKKSAKSYGPSFWLTGKETENLFALFSS